MPVFGTSSKKSLKQLHPLLQQLCNEAIKETDFRILDAVRGKDAQERAFAQGNSKARFGQSAHNYVPAVAMDLFPAPYDWNNKQSFIDLSRVVLPIAKRLEIPIRWLGDPNGDGKLADGWDFPHYELHPWRSYATKLYKG